MFTLVVHGIISMECIKTAVHTLVFIEQGVCNFLMLSQIYMQTVLAICLKPICSSAPEGVWEDCMYHPTLNVGKKA